MTTNDFDLKLVAAGGIDLVETKGANANRAAGEVGCTGSPADLIAPRPVCGIIRPPHRIDSRQTHAGPARGRGPVAVGAVPHTIEQATAVIDQTNSLAAIVKLAFERSENLRGWNPLGTEQLRLRSHHQIRPGRNQGPLNESVFHRTVQGPARQIDVDSHLIVQLDPFRRTDRGVILDLVEHHDTVSPPCRTQNRKAQTPPSQALPAMTFHTAHPRTSFRGIRCQEPLYQNTLRTADTFPPRLAKPRRHGQGSGGASFPIS